MALIACDECGQQISDGAAACPHCGYPGNGSVIVETATDPPQSASPGNDGAPSVYKAALGLGILSIFLGGTLGLLAWATVAVAGWALLSKKSATKRWMPWTGLILGMVFSLVNLYINGHIGIPEAADSAVGQGSDVATETATEQGVSVNDASLGFKLEDLPARWNSYEEPPYLIGEPDEIVEGSDRFEIFNYELDGPVVSGIFDPDDRRVYVLQISDLLLNRTHDEMMLHLCWTMAAADVDDSRRCFQAMVQEGGLSAFSGSRVSHIPDVEGTWEYGGHYWDLTYADSVLRIRVSSWK